MSETEVMVLRDKKGVQTLYGLMEADVRRAVPKHMQSDRVQWMMMMACAKNPDLFACSRASFSLAVMTACELGLDFSGVNGEAYIIPYKTTATLMPGYKGFLKLGRQSGLLKTWEAHVVYANDDFEFEYGTNPRLHHVPMLRGERGEPYCAYSVALTTNGGYSIEALTRQEIELAKKSSRAASSGPWQTHPMEMWRKTAVRRHAKYLPLSRELERLIELDNEADSMLTQAAPLMIEDAQPLDRYPVATMEAKIKAAGLTKNDMDGYREMTREQFDAELNRMMEVAQDAIAIEQAELERAGS